MNLEYRFLTYEKDREEVAKFMKKNDSYLIYQDNKAVNEKLARNFFYGELPMQKTYAEKQILGFYQNKELISLFDILKNYPRDKTWVIGLMLLAEEKRGNGVGTKLLGILESYLQIKEVEIIRLGVLADNELGKFFWKKMDLLLMENIHSMKIVVK